MKVKILVVCDELQKRFTLAVDEQNMGRLKIKHIVDYIRKTAPAIPSFALFDGYYQLSDGMSITDVKNTPIVMKLVYRVEPAYIYQQPLQKSYFLTPSINKSTFRHSINEDSNDLHYVSAESQPYPVYNDSEVQRKLQQLRELQANLKRIYNPNVYQSQQLSGSAEYYHDTRVDVAEQQKSVRSSAAPQTYQQEQLLLTEQEDAVPELQASRYSLGPALSTGLQSTLSGVQQYTLPQQTLRPYTLQQPLLTSSTIQKAIAQKLRSPAPPSPTTAVHTTELTSPQYVQILTLTRRNSTPVINRNTITRQSSQALQLQTELSRIKQELVKSQYQSKQKEEDYYNKTIYMFELLQQKLDYLRIDNEERRAYATHLLVSSDYSDVRQPAGAGLQLYPQSACSGRMYPYISLASRSVLPAEQHTSQYEQYQYLRQYSYLAKAEDVLQAKIDEARVQQQKHDEYIRLYRENEQAQEVQRENQALQREIDELQLALYHQAQQASLYKQDFENSASMRYSVQAEIKILRARAKDICLAQNQRSAFEVALIVEKLHQVVTQGETDGKTLQALLARRRTLHAELENLKGNIRVLVRIRPLLNNEQNAMRGTHVAVGDYLAVRSEQYLQVKLPSAQGFKNFNYYRVYDQQQSQKSVFSDIYSLLLSVIDGYNITIICYGATGAGKTFTLIGDNGEDAGDGRPGANDAYERLGILPRAVVQLFEQLRAYSGQFSVEVAMLEIYCDYLNDLLQYQSELKIRFYNDEYFVQNLNFNFAKSANECISLIAKGLESRHTGATKLNDRSSRSHAIIYLRLNVNGHSSIMQFCDLAGSERVEKSQSEGVRLKEAQFINSSLSALGEVVNALSMKKAHVPFRNSKLTQILQPGLGGDSKCLLFVNINPLWYNLHETYNSLVFGSCSGKVYNKAIRGIFE